MGMGAVPQKGKRHYLADINVTPLVDVMLVLLIIFMVTAPMMTKGLDVKLPAVSAKPLPQKREPVEITVNADDKIFLNKIPVDEETLRQRLLEMKDSGSAEQVLLRADRAVAYGVVAGVMATIREAGIEDLGLVTEPIDSAGAKGNKAKYDKKVNKPNK
ncbi:MAG: protein TolR [Dissulfurimicrobium sp.]|uniref:protein TolR n=1 Tax=Dissulfurimicrobium TaxID=1769732 RepID=UPI001EDB141E|nr:protein TolR [Dissulfurimicrobium hydrothermale]UKL14359.1 protein TolR [Dissulfurimicrobium hydrothermale]